MSLKYCGVNECTPGDYVQFNWRSAQPGQIHVPSLGNHVENTDSCTNVAPLQVQI